jgi:hypothetical protein
MEPNEDDLFAARVALMTFLLMLARKMREEATTALAAARRLDPGR